MTKLEMVDKLRRGHFGNTVRTWVTWFEFQTDFDQVIALHHLGGLEGRDILRMRTKVPGGKFRDHVLPFTLCRTDFDTHYLSEATPDKLTIIQGEFCDLAGVGPYLHYSRDPTNMVAALRGPNTREARGIVALEILRHEMDDAGFENLQNLRTEYPGHVIEFSVFSKGVGVRGWRSCFWECRDY